MARQLAFLRVTLVFQHHDDPELRSGRPNLFTALTSFGRRSPRYGRAFPKMILDYHVAFTLYLATMEEFFNASSNRTELRELSRSFRSNLTLEVANDAYWNQSYTFNLSSPGVFRLYFLLSKLPDDQTAYRTLYLTVRVRAS